MPNPNSKGISVQIDRELHAEITAYLQEHNMKMADFITIQDGNYELLEDFSMENTKTMTIQMPEETYQRMKEYLKRHQVKQGDFITRLLEAAMKNDGGSKPEGDNE